METWYYELFRELYIIDDAIIKIHFIIIIRKTKVLRKQPRRNLEWFTQRLTPENNKYFLIQG